MRRKSLSTIITFEATAAAMEAELHFLEHGLPGRMIPVPQEITASCGLAWKSTPESRELLLDFMNRKQLAYAGIYLMEV